MDFSLAQTNADRLVLYSIAEQDGLSDNRTTCVFQDNNGFMWIGTQDGLNRYDGSVVTKYRHHKNDSNSLPNNYVTAVASDEKRKLWISTLNGLCEYDSIHDIFHTYFASPALGNVNLMWDLFPDQNGNVWIASEAGLLQFVISEKKFIIHRNETIKDKSGIVRANWITKIIVDKKNRFWACSHYGLWQFFPDQNRFEIAVANVNSSFDYLINTVISDHNGDLWLGTWGEGIIKYSPDRKTVERLINHAIPANVFGLAEIKNPDGTYSVWGTGLIEIDGNKNVKSFFPNEIDRKKGFNYSTCYFSKDGLLWITSLAGAKIMDPSRQFFKHHFLSQNDLSSQNISFFENDQNQIYVGGEGAEFLKLYDAAFHVLRKFDPASALRTTSGDVPSVHAIIREDENHIWLSTASGLVLLDEKSGRQKIFRLSEAQINTKARNFFTSMFIDSRGRHWVFPWRSGVWQLGMKNGTFLKIQLHAKQDTTRRLVVASAIEDRKGTIWFADLDGGIMRYDEKKNEIEKFKPSVIGLQYGITKLEYFHPYIWFVKAGEVVRVNVNTEQIDSWPVPEELDKSISDFCSDQSGHIWICTRRGLISFDKKNFSFVRYNENDGLINDNLDGVLHCLKNGNMVLAMENFVTQFTPTQLTRPVASHRVIITGLLSHNKKIRIENTLSAEKRTELDYTFNNFKFTWALLNYSNPLGNHFYCKLEGVDKDWKYVGNKGYAEYASLLPGTYRFKVRGVTSDGAKSINDDSLLIVIHPPFWETWWFLILVVVTLVSGFYVVYRYRVNQLLLRERLRTKISTDLHDDIGSTLSSISILGDLVYHQLPAESKATAMVKEIRDNAQMLMEKMDDIVWGINPSNDSLEKLFLRLKKFAAQVLEARDIDYTIEVCQAVRHVSISMEYRQNIYLILKESINNLVKHSKCTKATIQVDCRHGFLIAKVADDGIGFTISEKTSRNGINNLMRRAALIKGNLKIDTSETGTTVLLTVKIT